MTRVSKYVMGGQGTLFVLLPLACILYSLTLGAYHISATHVYQILLADFTGVLPPDVTAMEVSMIYDVRLPRILGAVVAGCGLAVAGGVFQALFGNPLAPIRSAYQTARDSARPLRSCCLCRRRACRWRHSCSASCPWG